ncbi:hypothetical protein EMIT0P265_50199 [Pseudomonas zeae]
MAGRWSYPLKDPSFNCFCGARRNAACEGYSRRCANGVRAGLEGVAGLGERDIAEGFGSMSGFPLIGAKIKSPSP